MADFALKDTNPDYSLPIRAILNTLWRRRVLAGSLFLGVMLLTTAITLLTPRTYQSRMKLLVKNTRPDLVVRADSGSDSATNGDVRETQVNSEIELLRSSDILDRGRSHLPVTGTGVRNGIGLRNATAHSCAKSD